MSEFVSTAAQGVAPTALILVLVVIAAAAIRLIARDGYGHRPAPRGTEDWSAHGLPSRPYGC